MEDKIEMVLNSYGLGRVLEDNDLTEEFVLALLIELGYIKIDEYFDD